MTTKNRKEINLEPEIINILKIQAEKEGRKLKNYIEQILINTANEFKLSEEYKLMMDNMLENHYEGKLNYISENDFKRLIKKR